MKVKFVGLVFFLTLFSISSAQAALIGPVWPPPGGATWSQSGTSMGASGGVTWNYSGFNTSQFSSMYWAPVSIGLSMDGGGFTGAENISLTNFGSNPEGWGSTRYYNSQTHSYFPVDTKISLLISDLNGDIYNFTDYDLYKFDVMDAIKDTGGFKIIIQAFARDPGSLYWQPFDVYYNNHHTSGDWLAVSSLQGGLWYNEPSQVPEPSTLLLLGGGLAGLAAYRKRFKKA